jgi:hypothetical protein
MRNKRCGGCSRPGQAAAHGRVGRRRRHADNSTACTWKLYWSLLAVIELHLFLNSGRGRGLDADRTLLLVLALLFQHICCGALLR